MMINRRLYTQFMIVLLYYRTFYDSSEEFRAVAVLTLVAMVHEVENRISVWHRTADRNENRTVSIFVDVVSKLSSYIINSKYYFQIVTVLNFQQSIIMNIINSPERRV